jgi:hypothetical protein
VQSETAVVRDEPAAEGQVVASLVRGTGLVSQEKAGEWFRVVVKPSGGDMVVMGFIAAGDVKILKFREEAKADFWSEDTREFGGAGLSVRFSFGGGPLAGNDLSKGLRGRFKSIEAEILSGGPNVDAHKYRAPSLFYELGVDLEYRLAPRLWVFIGAGFARASARDVLRYTTGDYYDRGLEAYGSLEAVPIRLGLFYRMPLNRSLSAYGGAGGMYYRIDFESRQDDMRPNRQVLWGQFAKAGGVGFFSMLGAELNLTSRACIFLEAQGRYARIGGFEGTETKVVTGLPEPTSSRQGRLYFVEDADGARLSILESPPAGNAREAVLNLRSLSLWGGLRLKF